MFVDVFAAGIALASFLPPPVAPEPQGHQVTPQITEYVLLRSGTNYDSNSIFSAIRSSSLNRLATAGGTKFDVAFHAVVGGTSSFLGVFVHRDATVAPGTNTLVFRTGQVVQIPALAGTTDLTITQAAFTTPPAVSTSDAPPFGAGQANVADLAVVDAPSIAPTVVVFLKGPAVNNVLTPVCFEGQEVVSGTPTDVFGEMTAPLALAGDGSVGFHCLITGGTAVALADSAQSIQVIDRSGNPADGVGGGSFNVIGGATNSPFAPRFNSSARSAVRATTSGVLTTGVWRDGASSALGFVADLLTTADPASGEKFANFYAPVPNNIGMVAFRACLNALCTQTGIWRWSAGQVSMIARRGQGAPDESGTVGLDAFVSFSDPSLNDAGDVVFQATLQSGTQGIWKWHGNGVAGLRLVVDKGDVIRGTGAHVQIIRSQVRVGGVWNYRIHGNSLGRRGGPLRYHRAGNDRQAGEGQGSLPDWWYEQGDQLHRLLSWVHLAGVWWLHPRPCPIQ